MHKSGLGLLVAGKPALMPRLAAIPVLLGLIGWMEAAHPVPIFRLFTFLFVFLVVADLASLLRGKARDGLIVLASLAFGLGVRCVALSGAIEEKLIDAAEIDIEIFRPGKPMVGQGIFEAGAEHIFRTGGVRRAGGEIIAGSGRVESD